MNLQEFFVKFENDSFGSVKEMTASFNSLSFDERQSFLEELEKAEFDSFIKKIRQQAVKDFWWHEREAIKNGECTREWTAEQIEAKDVGNIQDVFV